MDGSETAQTVPADLRFIEAKSLDAARLAELLSASADRNHWANFGPVSGALEERLEAMLGIPGGKKVVLASSATTALFALAGVAAHRLGRALRWIGSAYGFRATRIGPMAQTRFVDCDRDGFLDLSEVERLPIDSWDGLLVTNLFGARADLTAYASFCRERGKALIADNALALTGFERSEEGCPEEVISFHHTKPWGFGEGGCAILAEADADLFRTLLTFGHQAPPGLEDFSLNGKLSDVSAAAILQWLDRAPHWAPRYIAQSRRIADLAKAAGYSVFAQPTPGAVFGFVPVLAPGPVSIEDIKASRLPLARYYPPLAERPNTLAIHRRMVCIPCHPGMEAVSDAIVSEQLAALLARSMLA